MRHVAEQYQIGYEQPAEGWSDHEGPWRADYERERGHVKERMVKTERKRRRHEAVAEAAF